MPQCSSCGKMCSYEGGEEPEMEQADFDPETGVVMIVVRAVKRSACCGEEVKECTFTLEEDIDGPALRTIQETAKAKDSEPYVEVETVEATEDTHPVFDAKGKVVPLRYRKTYYGVRVAYSIMVDGQPLYSGEMVDDVQASAWDDLSY